LISWWATRKMHPCGDRTNNLGLAAMYIRTLLTSALATSRLACAQLLRVLRFVPQADLALLDPVQTTGLVKPNDGMLSRPDRPMHGAPLFTGLRRS
jgi:hypothetical protein